MHRQSPSRRLPRKKLPRLLPGALALPNADDGLCGLATPAALSAVSRPSPEHPTWIVIAGTSIVKAKSTTNAAAIAAYTEHVERTRYKSIVRRCTLTPEEPKYSPLCPMMMTMMMMCNSSVHSPASSANRQPNENS